MDALFTLPGAIRLDPAIDAWLAARSPDLGALARHWFGRIRNCGDDVAPNCRTPRACWRGAAGACDTSR